MKGSKFFLMLVVAVVLAGIAWSLTWRDETMWHESAATKGGVLFEGLSVNDVAVVYLEGEGSKVTLRRGDDGWTVEERDGYPAVFGKISGLIKKIRNLKVVQSLPIAEKDRGVLLLKAPEAGANESETGMLVELRDDSGKKLVSMILGKVHETDAPGMPKGLGTERTGRYILPESSVEEAFLVGETFSDLMLSPSAWLKDDFVRPGLLRRIEVKREGDEKSWVLERKSHEVPWELVGAKSSEKVDTNKTLRMEAMLDGMSIADVAQGTEDARVNVLKEKPVEIVAETFSGLRYRFTVGHGDGDELPMTVVAEKVEGKGDDAGDAELEKLRADKLKEAEKFSGRVLFVPRNFFEPFFAGRNGVLVGK